LDDQEKGVRKEGGHLGREMRIGKIRRSMWSGTRISQPAGTGFSVRKRGKIEKRRRRKKSKSYRTIYPDPDGMRRRGLQKSIESKAFGGQHILSYWKKD